MFGDFQVLKNLPGPEGAWELVEVIGEGNYGEVFKARNVQTSKLAAIKVMEAVMEKEEDIRAELNVFDNHAHHPNIVDFFGAFVKKDQLADDQLWITMEYCSGGSVTDLVKEIKEKGERLTEDIIAYILREVLTGLCYLHSVYILHRDVKGQNVLLTRDARVKLIDFGISAVVDKSTGKRQTTIGTPYWMAPEVIACETQLDYHYDARADVWSLGITAIEIADGTPPHFGENPMRALFKIPRNKSPTVQHPSDWTPQLNSFISQCLVKDFEKRPQSNELLMHSFVRLVPRDPRVTRHHLMQFIDTYHKDSTTEHSTTVSAKRSLSLMDKVDDLATLEYIDESVIVSQLWKRYRRQIIYTYVGDILISINPFQKLDIYSDKYSHLYCSAFQGHLPPHIFAIATSAYKSMVQEKRDQCCVVSGESGAGKTEASNFLVQQFMNLGRAETKSLEEKILKVNPLIESFGNAKTVINENSSRFGKYLELRFTSDGHVVGGHLSEYLLEKSRVVSQARRERNFHIFYCLLAGLSARNQLEKYKLKSAHQHHRYLEHRGTHKRNIKKDAILKKRFDLIENAFQLFDFSKKEFESVCSILAAILNIGDVRLEADSYSYLGEVSTITSLDKVEAVGHLLQIKPDELHHALISSQVVTYGETIIKPNTIEQAMDTRDAIAKALYGRLFSWIVNKINPALNPPIVSSSKVLSIGILDIFGFENLRTNSFEQLCINVANEQLQFYFNQQVFAWEQEEYGREGVDVSQVSYIDNRPLLELLMTRPIGLLALLDEESKFPRATDLSLAAKFHSNFASTPYYKKPKDGGPTFTILHYAGQVTYETAGFLEKNRDTVKSEVSKILRKSSNHIVQSLFHTPLSRTGSLSAATGRTKTGPTSATPLFSRRAPFVQKVGGVYHHHAHRPTSPRSRTPLSSSGMLTTNRFQTVSTYFINSLRELMSKMLLGKPHFVRCIRPNEMKSPEQFQPDKVLTQLRYTGVLETTRIRREGFSHRILFEDFIQRYKVISYPLSAKVAYTLTNCVQILMQAGLEKWVPGKTKVFLKYYHVERLSQVLTNYDLSATNIQKAVRGWLARKRASLLRLERKNCAAIKIQAIVRGHLARGRYVKLLQQRQYSALKLQAAIRGWLARSLYLQLLHRRQLAAIKIQCAVRGWLSMQQQRKLREQAKKKLEAFHRDSIRWKLEQHALASIQQMKRELNTRPVLIRGTSNPTGGKGLTKTNHEHKHRWKKKDTVGNHVHQGEDWATTGNLHHPANHWSRHDSHPVMQTDGNIQQYKTATATAQSQLHQLHLKDSAVSATPDAVPNNASRLTSSRQGRDGNTHPPLIRSALPARLLFEELIKQQTLSFQQTNSLVLGKPGGRWTGNQRVKERKPRCINPDSIIHQLLVRFDPGSFTSIVEQVQS